MAWYGSQSRKFVEAVADLDEAIKLNPRQYSAFVTRAQIYRQEHRLVEAIKQLDRAIALRPPDSARLYRTRALWNLERRDLIHAVRAAALDDLEQAIQLDSPGSPDLAKDLAKRAQILLLAKRYPEALDACDRALKITPNDADAHRWRVAALLELKRYQDVIDCCDGYFRAGNRSADLLELARARQGQAKRLRRRDRGLYAWLSLSSPRHRTCMAAEGGPTWSPGPPSSPSATSRRPSVSIRPTADAYSGRGSALVALGHYQDAAADAEESLRHGEPEPRLFYNAARILAQAAESAGKEASRQARPDLASVRRYQDRALKLLGQALERTPPEQRPTFWREVVRADHALSSIRRLPEYARWAAEYAGTAR